MIRACLLAFALVAGCSSGATKKATSEPTTESIRLVVVSHGQASDPFWSVVKTGVDEAASKMGVRVEYRAPATFDMVSMAQLIDAAVASKPDGLAVSIPDAEALGDSIRAAVAAGIPVVSLNSGSDVREKLGALVHVGQTEYEAGLGGGARMKDSGVTRAMCINHEVGNVALDLRCEGFAKGFAGPVEVLSVSADPTETKNRVMAALQKSADVDGILCLGPVGAEPTLAALKELGRSSTVKLGSFDLSPALLEALGDGSATFLIDQQQYLQGYLPVVLLTLYEKYGVMPGADVLTGPGFVTKDNAAQVVALSKRGYR